MSTILHRFLLILSNPWQVMEMGPLIKNANVLKPCDVISKYNCIFSSIFQGYFITYNYTDNNEACKIGHKSLDWIFIMLVK